MVLSDHEWFSQERLKIADVQPDAMFREAGQVVLTADVLSGDRTNAFELAVIYDESEDMKEITGVRVYPVIPSVNDLMKVVADTMDLRCDEVMAMLPEDASGNHMLPDGNAKDGCTALAHAGAFLTLLQQLCRYRELNTLRQMLEDKNAWLRRLPPFGMYCFGRLVKCSHTTVVEESGRLEPNLPKYEGAGSEEERPSPHGNGDGLRLMA